MYDVKKKVLIIFLASFLLITPFYLIQRNIQSIIRNQEEQRKILGAETQKEKQGLPLHLIIPAINVNANVQHLGINEKGEMDVPDNTADVGWFNLGPRPGEIGSAVKDGHFNGKDGASGIFKNLFKLKSGDKLYVEDDIGVMTTFIVREIRTYNPGYEEEVFSLNDNAHLNLITCDGTWDETRKSYSKRLIVFADISP